MTRIRVRHLAAAGLLGLVVLPLGHFDPGRRDPAPPGRAEACGAVDQAALRDRLLDTRRATYQPPDTPSNLDRTYPFVDTSLCDLVSTTGRTCDREVVYERQLFVYVLRTAEDAEARFLSVRLNRTRDKLFRDLEAAPPAYTDGFGEDRRIALSWSGRVIYGLQARPCAGAGSDAIEAELAAVLRAMQVDRMIVT